MTETMAGSFPADGLFLFVCLCVPRGLSISSVLYRRWSQYMAEATSRLILAGHKTAVRAMGSKLGLAQAMAEVRCPAWRRC